MRILAATGLLFFLGGSLLADDPCALLGLGGRWQPGAAGVAAGGQCVRPNGQAVTVSDADLLVRIISNQVNEINALKTAVDGLTKAVASLESTSKNLMAADRKWQGDTLSSTIAEVDKLPSTLAAEKGLQDILLAAVKEKLLKDPAFLQAVKKAP